VVRDVTVEHRALTDLTAADELHHMLMSQTSDVIALTSPVDARYTWVSPSAARVLGWEYGKLVGRSVYDFIHPEDAAAVRAARNSLLGEREQASVTFRYRRPSGGFIWIEGQVRRVRDAEGAITGLLASLRDVTERKRLEAELSRARTSFELAFAAAPIGMSLVSIDGRFLRVNDALCKLLGRDEDSLLRATFRDITHVDDLGTSNELLRAMLDGTARDGRMEKRFLRPDGSVAWGLLALASSATTTGGRASSSRRPRTSPTARTPSGRSSGCPPSTFSPGCRTGCCSWTGCGTRSRWRAAAAGSSGWCRSTSTGSPTSTTPTGTRSATTSCARSPGGSTPRPGWATPRRASAATSS